MVMVFNYCSKQILCEDFFGKGEYSVHCGLTNQNVFQPPMKCKIHIPYSALFAYQLLLTKLYSFNTL